MVVDRLEVLGLDHIGRDALIAIEPYGDVAYQVFDESCLAWSWRG